MPDPDLGSQLQRVRKLRGLSLKAAAEPAGISAAYLQKLERGQVKSPSPNVLFRLGGVLDVPYSALMKAAGYVVPDGDKKRAASANVLSYALSSEDLTAEEATALASYLAFIRGDRAASSR
jgi:HTH-type transcriptional regulator, competence development regulator